MNIRGRRTCICAGSGGGYTISILLVSSFWSCLGEAETVGDEGRDDKQSLG